MFDTYSLPETIPLVQLVTASQTVAAGARPDTKTLTTCQDVESLDTRAAVNDLTVVQASLGALGYSFDKLKGEYKIPAEEFSRIAASVSIVVAPKHGVVTKVNGVYPLWHYEATAEFVGKDFVAFVVEWKGQRVYIGWNLWVTRTVSERDDGYYDCNFVQFGQVSASRTLPTVRRHH